MTEVPGPLKRLYKDGRLVVFVGAGASTAVEWTNADQTKSRGITWRGLVDRAAQLLGHPDADLLRVRGNDLQILEFFNAVDSGPTRLTNWFLQQMNPPDEALKASPIHQALVGLDACNLF